MGGISSATAIRIRGQVQGVGFRPFVWHLAKHLGITGEVWNDAEGVMIHAWGDAQALARFQRQMRTKIPPLAHIDTMECSPLQGMPHPATFSIVNSRDEGRTAGAITPDASTCPHCMADILDPADRHHGYAFTSCTHCGPRLSILRDQPYDRAHTSMASFAMCPACQAEYEQPADRRFHAQTNACPACGPRLWLEDVAGQRLDLPDAQIIERTVELLRSGHIVAIKGIGGVHLAADAGSEEAVGRLRARKRRYGKPFALMAPDLDCIARFADVGEAEAHALTSSAAPIVLLERRSNGEPLAAAVAPGQSRLGFMLPYSPLHILLMRHFNRPIVLTSGNRSDEPQCIDNAETRERLAGIADFLLLHDRDIVNRLDDSVAALMDGDMRLLRRSRGYAPAPLALHGAFNRAPRVLAMGGELKNTFCQLGEAGAVVSHHLGDLEDAATHADYRKAMSLYARMFGFNPEAIAVDLHPDYHSTRLGQQMAQQAGIPLLGVQHHHAHIASVLAEHRHPLDGKPVLGIALDGLGLGADGTLWGGEFMLADYAGYQRLGCFAPLAMPGGAQAIREPWRNSLAHLHACGWETIAGAYADTDIVRFLSDKPLASLQHIITQGVNAPLSSSCGRLFDAVAAALGLCRESIAYEGQAAIELESMAQSAFSDTLAAYPYSLDASADGISHIDWRPMWPVLLTDIQGKVPAPLVAARFHRTVASAVAELAMRLCHEHALRTVVLGGGCFHNGLLLETTASSLRAGGREVLSARNVPAGDGGLALGQATVCAARMLKGEVR